MDDAVDNETEKTAQKLTDDVRNMGNYKSLYSEIQVEYFSSYFTDFLNS